MIGIEGVIDADARRFPTLKCIDHYFFTARCYAERGIAKESCLSVRPSVCDDEVSADIRFIPKLEMTNPERGR